MARNFRYESSQILQKGGGGGGGGGGKGKEKEKDKEEKETWKPEVCVYLICAHRLHGELY